MTVLELKKRLDGMPDHAEVLIETGLDYPAFQKIADVDAENLIEENGFLHRMPKLLPGGPQVNLMFVSKPALIIKADKL